MSAIHHAELQRIFTHARTLEGTARAAFLNEACGSDESLGEEVAALLAIDAEDAALDVAAGGAELLAGSLVESGDLEAPVPALPERIGRYRILRVLAEGGMGTVYEAEQDDPRRRVALKVVRPSMVTPELLGRFRHEARVLGHLQHPGIARIYEAGTADSCSGAQPFFAMELVTGRRLDAFVAEEGLDVPARLEVVARLCDVLQYAHQRGVIHRDLKPSNILVSDEATTPSSSPRSSLVGLPQLKILDFGVARATEAEVAAVTLSTTPGQLVGTVPYMSPEQAAGDPDGVDTRSDVYAVGVIAHELLAGRLPYAVRGKLVHEAVRIIQEEEPTRLGTIDRALRGDVETIVAKALEKERERRYASAGELAADIRRYLADEPILARPPTTLYQVRQFARRNKTLVGGTLATLFVAVAGAALATSFAMDANRRADELELSNYVAGLAAANSAAESQDHVSATAYLDGLPEGHHGWELDYLRAKLVHHEGEWELPAPLRGPLAIDEEQGLLFGALTDGTVRTWDAVTGQMLRTVSAGDSWTEGSPVLLHGPSRRLAASLQGNRLAILELDAPDQVRVVVPGPSTNSLMALAWDETGERLLYSDGRFRLWDGERSRQLLDQHVNCAALNRAGTHAALAGQELGGVELIDVATGQRVAGNRLKDYVQILAFSPDDAHLAVGCPYGDVHLLDGRTLETRVRLVGHRDMIQSMDWSADGSRLVTSGADGTVRIWDPTRPDHPVVHEAALGPRATAVFLPDSTHVVAGGQRLVRFLVEGSNVLRGHASYVYRLSFSPDGSLLVSAGFKESELMVWDVHRGRIRSRHPAPPTNGGWLFGAAPIADFSEDGRRLVAATAWGIVHWDLESGEALPVNTGEDPLDAYLETLGRREGVRVHENGIALSRDGKLASAHTNEVILEPAEVADPREWRMSPMGQLPSPPRVGDAAPLGRLHGPIGPIYCVAFSPDCSRLATGGKDGLVRLWDTETYEQLLVLRGHTQYVHDLQFSPDGTVLASASGDHTIRLWDTLPRHERRAMK